MVRKRLLFSAFDENPTTTQITVRQIAQLRKTRKVPCPCSKCEGNLVHPRTKSKHELLEKISALGVSENFEPRENINPGSSQLYTLNEQKINNIQQEYSA